MKGLHLKRASCLAVREALENVYQVTADKVCFKLSRHLRRAQDTWENGDIDEDKRERERVS